MIIINLNNKGGWNVRAYYIGIVQSICIIFSLITISFIGLLVFDRMTRNIGVEAATIIVDYKGDGDYTSIQEAIDNANPGDTVRVWAGTYYENIKITKNISIIGNGSKFTTVNASGSGSNFHITANWRVVATGHRERTAGGCHGMEMRKNLKSIRFSGFFS